MRIAAESRGSVYGGLQQSLLECMRIDEDQVGTVLNFQVPQERQIGERVHLDHFQVVHVVQD